VRIPCRHCMARFCCPIPAPPRCWRCNKEIDGYRHFRSGDCVLFDEAEILRCVLCAWVLYKKNSNWDW
jgi:hypothetical protein